MYDREKRGAIILHSILYYYLFCTSPPLSSLARAYVDGSQNAHSIEKNTSGALRCAAVRCGAVRCAAVRCETRQGKERKGEVR